MACALPVLLLGFVGVLDITPTETRAVTPAPVTEVVDSAATVAVPSLTPEFALRALPTHVRRFKAVDPAHLDEETLWLARCIFSESKRPEEQELIAWVVRNRVDTRYRGVTTYKDAVLAPYQFSAFNPSYPKRGYYTSLMPTSKPVGWKTALRIAHQVRHADVAERPFPLRTRHLYSERSMTAERPHPDWAEGEEPVVPNRPLELDEERFRFYSGIS